METVFILPPVDFAAQDLDVVGQAGHIAGKVVGLRVERLR